MRHLEVRIPQFTQDHTQTPTQKLINIHRLTSHVVFYMLFILDTKDIYSIQKISYTLKVVRKLAKDWSSKRVLFYMIFMLKYHISWIYLAMWS